MRLSQTYRFLIEIIFFISGLLLMFLINNNYWIGEIIAFLGLSIFIVDLIAGLIRRKRNIQTISVIFFIFIILNLIRHFEFYTFNIEYYQWIPFKFFLELFWLIPSLLMICVFIRLVVNRNMIDYLDYTKTKDFIFAIGFMVIAIILEFPVFGIHNGFFSGLHGHGLWDAWTHIH